MPMTGYITRTELGMGDLSLTSTSHQADVEGIREAGLLWRRRTVQSPFVDGTFEVSAVRDAGELSLRVWALGTTSAELRTATMALIAAVEQPVFALWLAQDEFDYRFYCNRADYTVGLTSGHVRALAVPVNLTIPYQPNYGLV